MGLIFRDFGVGVWLGFVGGSPKKSIECLGVDFGACEWCGTTTACGRGRGVAVNVNIAPPALTCIYPTKYKLKPINIVGFVGSCFGRGFGFGYYIT